MNQAQGLYVGRSGELNCRGGATEAFWGIPCKGRTAAAFRFAALLLSGLAIGGAGTFVGV